MIEAIREAVIYLAHTHDGARVAMHCLWHGTPKVLFRFCLPSPLIVVQSETLSLIAHFLPAHILMQLSILEQG